MRENETNLSWIDTLRGIAICMVIATHCGGLYNNIIIQNVTVFGQMGVQLFFFLSALTLSISFKKRNENKAITKFYIRRLFRIFPLYYIGIIVYYFINGIIKSNNYYYFEAPKSYNFENVLANLTFINGFYKPANNNIVPGGWSIGTEMAFYLIFPIIWYYLKNKFIKINNTLKLFSIILISFLYTIAINYFYDINILNNEFYYFNIANQISVFIIGILYFENRLIKPLQTWFATIIFLMFIFISIVIWKMHFIYSFYFVPITSAIAFWGLTDLIRNINDKISLVLLKIGRVSFSVYIFHFAIIKFYTEIGFLKIFDNNLDILSFIFCYLIILSSSYFIGKISNKYIEVPFINLGKKLIQSI